MWIVLLDHSSSMAEPFQADSEQIRTVGRIRSVEAEIKWEAAKKSFLLELTRLPGDMEVLLVGFTSRASIIYGGLASQVEEFESRLQSVSPNNGTNIAVALQSVEPYADRRPQVLLITDGKSNVEEAKAAARNCSGLGIRVDLLVIDPTNQGLEMAKAIAGITQGRWDPVTSSAQLENATREASEAHQSVQARAEEIIQQAEVEFQEISRVAQDKTRVSFSAGFPSRMDIHQKSPMVVYIHLEHLQENIREFLKQEITSTGASLSSSSAAATTRIPQGTLITVRPNIPDIFSNPPQQEVVWMEEYHRLFFEIRYTGDKTNGTTCSGFVDVFANDMLVGNIPVSLAINAQSGSLADLKPILSTGSSFTRIFASYAHEDTAIVQACKEAYKLLGIHLYVDRDDLLSGQPWRATLQKLIATSDLFQLYWSKSSADSIEVEKEWRLALQVSTSRPNNFIRPFYWQESLPKPPRELGHIHFAYLDTRRLRITADREIYKKELPEDTLAEIEAVFPIIALTDKDTKSSMQVLQKSIGQVTSYLERLTGLRYYPPTTMLVDDYVVQAVRKHLVVENNPAPAWEQESEVIEFVLGILQALALAFHVHALEPEGSRNDEWPTQFYSLQTDLEQADLRHVRRMCEYIFAGPVKNYLNGEDPFKQPSHKKPEELQAVIDEHMTRDPGDFWVRYNLNEEVGHFYDVATTEDRNIIEQVFGRDILRVIVEDNGQLTREQLGKIKELCVSNVYLSVTQKYRNGFYDFFKDGETSLSRSNSYAEYLAVFFDSWLQYLKIIAEKNNIEARIGYQPPNGSLRWLRSRFPDTQLVEGSGWRISTPEILKTVERLRTTLMNTPRQDRSQTTKVTQYFISRASTYGIFASAQSHQVTRYLLKITQDQNWPSGLALEGNHKVLLCTNALERYQTELLELGVDKPQAESMSTWFLVATLVHEHFHGILASGVDRHGKGSWASRNWNEWQNGDLLNESLAAWTERHFFRNNQTMFENISAYIQSGEYPDWPYQGAEKVEEIYKQQGIRGVRALIAQLREDPQFAQEAFDGLPF